MALEFFKFSGRGPLGGLLAGQGAGVLSAVVLGPIYGTLSLFLLPGLLQGLGAVVLGAAVGYLVSKPMVLGHVRHPWLVGIVAVVSAGLALSFSWGSWLWLVDLSRVGEISARPAPGGTHFGLLLTAVTRFGTWGFWWSEGPVRGWGWALLVIAEVTLVLGTAIWVSRRIASAHPYCETCHRWCHVSRGVVFRRGGRLLQRELVSQSPNALVRLLQSLPKPRTTDPSWLQGDLFSCPRCNRFHTFNLVQLKRGFLWLRRSPLLRHALLDGAAAQSLETPRRDP